MKITLGFSPCPNDTFIFDALVNKKIDTEGLEFEAVLEDIQTLNEWAASGRLDVTKLSFPALFAASENYVMLSSGAALGKGVGPLLVARKMIDLPNVQHCTVAIPGLLTTANFLLSFAFPGIEQKKPFLFSSIEDAVVNGEVDMGVIIHENRFTYHQKGLIKVCDLGSIWEERLNLPIPLASIAALKSLDPVTRERIQRLIRKSLEYSFERYPEITAYTREHAQAMDEEVMRRHIELYVNNFSLDLGEEGRNAINKLQEVYKGIEQQKLANPV